MLDYGGLRVGILANFGETVAVTIGAATVSLTAVFMSPYAGVDVGGAQIDRPEPQFIAATADWAALDARAGDVITRNGIAYTIVDAQPTDDGMTVIRARAY